jgi:hypothetical protein
MSVVASHMYRGLTVPYPVMLHTPGDLPEYSIDSDCCRHHAGLCQLSRFRQLRHLSLEDSFPGCTHKGLIAALATMTGIDVDHANAKACNHAALL